ncbi:MAG: glycosyltransferase family 2 protein [Sediminibacterium sp.]|uniref:glycosyltransferase family 2 protein n=1 Tax=Sediminibacterium sp. TaxID=1917865 RepID=UPI002AB83BA0|nr:glycosyltransferase family 2 protein [Sediminibacterium sp.]MDZ4071965.1 glycosyltransferase family 2 protein [Sediminibacterium sp.]
MTLSIIIVNYNVRAFLEQCIRTVLIASHNINTEIIVVDNGSSEDCIPILQPLFPKVQFIRSDINMGFAKANNLALQKASGSFVLFLNPDTLLTPFALSTCLQHFATHEQTGALGIRMINGFGEFLPESKRALPSISTAFFKLSGLARIFPSSGVFNRYALGDLSPLQNHQVEVLAGAFMMVRKNILDTLGGFDTDYFMYGEDIDLSLRISKTGYTLQYLGEPPIVHYKGQSSKHRTVFHTAIFFQAMKIFVQKNYRLGWMLIPFIQLLSIWTQFKKKISKSGSTEALLQAQKNLLVICKKEYEADILSILEQQNRSHCHLSSIYLHQQSTTILSNEIRQYKAEQILIRIPDMDMSDAISLMEKNKGIFFRFIFADSATISFNN